MNIKKKIACLYIIIFFISFSFPVWAEETDIRIKLDNKDIPCKVKVIDGRVMVPLLTLADIFKLNITWHSDREKITIATKDKKIDFCQNNNQVNVNNHVKYLDVSIQYLDKWYYLPLRFVAENLGYKVIWDSQNHTVYLKRVFQNNIIISSIKEEKETDMIIVNIQYPQIKGLNDPLIEKGINDVIEQHVKDYKDSQLARLTEIIEAGKDGSDGLIIKYYVGVDYKITYNQKGLLNIVFVESIYSGGAHGMAFKKSYLCNLESGEFLKIKDIFKDNTDYVAILSDKIKTIMNEKEITPYLLVPFESIKEEQSFYLTDDNNLVVFFQIYEYTPYAAGFLEFSIPFRDIYNILAIK